MFKPRPAPLTPAVEVATIDNRIRMQLWRINNAQMTEQDRADTWTHIDALLARRHQVAPGEEL